VLYSLVVAAIFVVVVVCASFISFVVISVVVVVQCSYCTSCQVVVVPFGYIYSYLPVVSNCVGGAISSAHVFLRMQAAYHPISIQLSILLLSTIVCRSL